MRRQYGVVTPVFAAALMLQAIVATESEWFTQTLRRRQAMEGTMRCDDCKARFAFVSALVEKNGPVTSILLFDGYFVRVGKASAAGQYVVVRCEECLKKLAPQPRVVSA